MLFKLPTTLRGLTCTTDKDFIHFNLQCIQILKEDNSCYTKRNTFYLRLSEMSLILELQIVTRMTITEHGYKTYMLHFILKQQSSCRANYLRSKIKHDLTEAAVCSPV